MGLTKVECVVKKNYESQESRRVDFLVDSGAAYSVVSRQTFDALGIRPHRGKAFFLANGERAEREIGDAYFEYGGVGGAAPVIFGEEGDSELLGATTLEALEPVLDPKHCDAPTSRPRVGGHSHIPRNVRMSRLLFLRRPPPRAVAASLRTDRTAAAGTRCRR